jgi:hypothetical protein
MLSSLLLSWVLLDDWQVRKLVAAAVTLAIIVPLREKYH